MFYIQTNMICRYSQYYYEPQNLFTSDKTKATIYLKKEHARKAIGRMTSGFKKLEMYILPITWEHKKKSNYITRNKKC